MPKPTPQQDHGIPCALMRGGSSKGAFFLAADLPAEPAARDDLLLRLLGSPDERQIDGIGGGHPLTSKVAVVAPSTEPDADVTYLFAQVAVAESTVSTGQTCGNLLAAVGAFAIERKLVAVQDGDTTVRVRLVNTGGLATVTVPTPGGRVTYDGDTRIAGVPFAGARILIGVEPSAAPLLPTGRVRDTIAGYDATLIDNGMPSVLLAATALGVTGYESPAELEANAELAQRVTVLRRAAFTAMRLRGSADTATVPKVVLLSPGVAYAAPGAPPAHLTTRSFIPVRVHEALGVLGAASIAAALRLPGTVAHEIAHGIAGNVHVGPDDSITLAHPTGTLQVSVPYAQDTAQTNPARPSLGPTSIIRTARLLFDGLAYPRSKAESHD